MNGQTSSEPHGRWVSGMSLVDTGLVEICLDMCGIEDFKCHARLGHTNLYRSYEGPAALPQDTIKAVPTTPRSF